MGKVDLLAALYLLISNFTFVVGDTGQSNWVFHSVYVTESCIGSGWTSGDVTVNSSGQGSYSGNGLDNEGTSITFSGDIDLDVDGNGKVIAIDTTGGGSNIIFDNGILNADKNTIVSSYIDGDNDVHIEIFVRKGPGSSDFDRDGDVDLTDLTRLASAWLSVPGDSTWNAICDINVSIDNMIGLADFGVLANRWQE